MDRHEDNIQLRQAWEFVEHTGRSIFLTGKAGTGKTTFLKAVVERSRKRSIVVAPTGVAAINAGGMTIHSFFQLPFSPFVPDAKIKSKFEFGREKRKIIASLDLLIIDEISMVRSDLLDAIDSVLRRFRDRYQPFGGVQLLMIGDLGQLTPVVTPEDEQMLQPYYDTPYFFGSKALSQTQYVTIQLEKVYRQQDDAFISILNHIREGQPTAEDLALLNSRYRADFTPRPDEGYIRLTTHNQFANHYNESELRKLSTPAFVYQARIEGTFPDYAYPTNETLELKVGTQVMFVKNDPSGEHRYYNGRIGQVTRLTRNSLFVRCPGDTDDIEVEPLEWENARYTLNEETREIQTEIQGTFTQYPLRLAWAITIHKSQGLTFDHAIIDANHSFAPGQVYVALSRCRTLQGMVLASPLSPHAIINDRQVDSYMERQEDETQQSISQLPVLKQEYHRHLLLELFDFRPVLFQEEYLVRLFMEYFYHSHDRLTHLHKQALDDLRNSVTDVANKWAAVIAAMPAEALHADDFLQRVRKGSEYFARQLEQILMRPIALTAEVKTNNKQAMKRLGTALPELQQTWLSRRYLLSRMGEEPFSVATYLRQKQIAMLDALDEKKVKQKRQKKEKAPKLVKEKTWVVSYNLFQQGMTPELIAHERSLTVGTIMGHLARYVTSGELALTDLIAPERIATIRQAAQTVQDSNYTKNIKDLCPPNITYDEIRIVMRLTE